MTAAVTLPPERQPWRRLVLATAALILLPMVPHMRSLLPIEQTMMLVIPAVAACALAGWRNGERLAFAAIWTAVAVWMLAQSAGAPGSSYDYMARGWALLLAACFGLSGILAAGVAFFPRALASLGVATLVAFGVAASSAGGVQRISSIAKGEFERRNAESIATLNRNASTREWKELAAKSPVLAASVAAGEEQLESIPKVSTMLLGSILGLESLAALALAWAFYHRFATIPVGPPLARMREFTFNDQLIWGLAVGATIFLLPPFAEGRSAGINLLLFFGSLYMVRGLGIIAWMSNRRAIWTTIAFVFVLGVFTPAAWPLFVLLVGFLALALGLGDTWLDWRKRAQSI
jgi:hypothetical protein